MSFFVCLSLDSDAASWYSAEWRKKESDSQFQKSVIVLILTKTKKIFARENKDDMFSYERNSNCHTNINSTNLTFFSKCNIFYYAYLFIAYISEYNLGTCFSCINTSEASIDQLLLHWLFLTLYQSTSHEWVKYNTMKSVRSAPVMNPKVAAVLTPAAGCWAFNIVVVL